MNNLKEVISRYIKTKLNTESARLEFQQHFVWFMTLNAAILFSLISNSIFLNLYIYVILINWSVGVICWAIAIYVIPFLSCLQIKKIDQ